MGILSLLHPWGHLASPLKRPSHATQGWAASRAARSDIHRGMDLRAAVGDPAYAAGSGRVVAAEHGSPSAGNWIAIEHSGGLVTRYLHLSRIDVKSGQQVSKGQQIGATGNTGNSAGPHLHFDAFVPESKIATYDSLFTRPEGGYTKSGLGFGVKVPVEPLIPVDSYSDAIIKYSMTHQLPLRGGAGRWLALAGVGAVGFVLWKNRAAIRRRLGQ